MSTTAGATPAMDMAAFRKLAKYPLIKASDMSADMREDAIDIISISVEKHAADLEKCAKVIKEAADAKFGGGPFHCVVGQAFAFEVTHEVKTIIYVFVDADHGVVLWK